jgi:hypothetical protein
VPGAGLDIGSGGVERYRQPIDQFAETIIEKSRQRCVDGVTSL